MIGLSSSQRDALDQYSRLASKRTPVAVTFMIIGLLQIATGGWKLHVAFERAEHFDQLAATAPQAAGLGFHQTSLMLSGDLVSAVLLLTIGFSFLFFFFAALFIRSPGRRAVEALAEWARNNSRAV
jgi:hypothetical protein